jgi:hypothetical protein
MRSNKLVENSKINNVNPVNHLFSRSYSQSFTKLIPILSEFPIITSQCNSGITLCGSVVKWSWVQLFSSDF